MHTDVCQFERLLRAIYRPQNVYCIHIDANADTSIHNAVTSLSLCFPNILLATTRITWGTPSILHAMVGCMEQLVRHRMRWKYYINLAGQEFPLRTNLQLVRIVKLLNGGNLIDGSEKQYASCFLFLIHIATNNFSFI